jgi:flagellar basal-body rod protein FlgF
MDNALYVGLSRQMTLRRELDIVANNIANANTTGFKVEELMVRTEPAKPARTVGGANPVKFVLDDGVARDFGQGALTQTGGDFDLALEGQGFFKVSTAGGERYTRDGRFTMSPDGKLVTQNGQAVLDEGGGEINLDPLKGPVTIARDGTVSQGAERSARSPWCAPPTWPPSARTATTSIATPPTTPPRPPRTPRSTRACWKPPTSNRSPRSPS